MCLKIVFIAICADPDEMLHLAAFHLVFAICHSTFLTVSRLERVNNEALFTLSISLVSGSLLPKQLST